jgi:hypothetical protein
MVLRVDAHGDHHLQVRATGDRHRHDAQVRAEDAAAVVDDQSVRGSRRHLTAVR